VNHFRSIAASSPFPSDARHRKDQENPLKNGADRAINAFGDPLGAEKNTYFSLR
jgi:hypothetical protein